MYSSYVWITNANSEVQYFKQPLGHLSTLKSDRGKHVRLGLYFVLFAWGRGGNLIHSCVVILKQAIKDPPLNTDTLNMKLWPLITNIHSLTYCNNPHNSRKSSILNWEKMQKCHKSLQNSGKNSTTVEFHAFELLIWDCWKVCPFFQDFMKLIS